VVLTFDPSKELRAKCMELGEDNKIRLALAKH
jgi:hypothetical protein